ncbi:hypothetical protein [Cellulosimicrobium sp. Marseille-Q4280]|uniref:hypothetical protein n=1 Tax=Cellulosimicrobium sp. Marseille-Q4280 TaxID=2937992 RepID=UPI00203B1408|nr:hypothetical protein [Cellulosimicrobium sp. Marseille-Q4280]
MTDTAPAPTIDGAPVTCLCGGTAFTPALPGLVQCTACHELFDTSGFDAPTEPDHRVADAARADDPVVRSLEEAFEQLTSPEARAQVDRLIRDARATPVAPDEEARLLGVPIARDDDGRPTARYFPIVQEPSDLQQVLVRYEREDLVPVVADGARVDGERRLHGAVRRVPVIWDAGPAGELARCKHGHVRVSAALSCAQILLDDLAGAQTR